jgi:hypothetical protein
VKSINAILKLIFDSPAQMLFKYIFEIRGQASCIATTPNLVDGNNVELLRCENDSVL